MTLGWLYLGSVLSKFRQCHLMVPDTKSSHFFASSDTLPITKNMETKCLHHWLDGVQTHQNPTSPSNITEELDTPPTKRRKRSPSLTSTSSTQITEQSCSSDSSSLTCGTYHREREEDAELVTRTVMALSSILAEPRIIYRLPPGIRCPESAISVRRELSKDFGMKLIPLEFKVCSDSAQSYYTWLSDDRQDKIEEADGEMPDFAYDDGNSLSPGQLEILWENIQEIYIKATECSRLSQDENAWSLVLYDILNFALRHKFNLRPTNMWVVTTQIPTVSSYANAHNSKLQTIEPEILPRLPHHDLSDINSGKVNYVFALFPRSSEIGKSLWWFKRAWTNTLGPNNWPRSIIHTTLRWFYSQGYKW